MNPYDSPSDFVPHPLLPAPTHWKPPILPFNCLALPPLPALSDTKTLRQIWLDGGSSIGRQNLAWEGDSVLHLAATMHLLQTRGKAVVLGPICAMRDAMLTNNTFSYLAIAYRLIPHEPSISCRQKPAADVFEAYIGAWHREASKRGEVHEVRDWLGRLFHISVWPDLQDVEGFRRRRTGALAERIRQKIATRRMGAHPRRVEGTGVQGSPMRAKRMGSMESTWERVTGQGRGRRLGSGVGGSDGSDVKVYPTRQATSNRTRFLRSLIPQRSRKIVIDLTASDEEDDDIVPIDSLPTHSLLRSTLPHGPRRNDKPELSYRPPAPPDDEDFVIDLSLPSPPRPTASRAPTPSTLPLSSKASRSLRHLLDNIANAFAISPRKKTGAEARVVAARKSKKGKDKAVSCCRQDTEEEMADPGQAF